MLTIPADVRNVLNQLRSFGYEAYIVGGAVRDLLLGTEPYDYDVATNAMPEKVYEIFDHCSMPTGIRHGTITVLGQVNVEVTTYRKDGAYADHRHPESVEFTDRIEEDLRRRDFTVNAMAMDVEGNIIDPFGGREDLERKILRTVGDAEERFFEDALRMLRCLRFAATLGFSIEEATEKALFARKNELSYLAGERVRAEFDKLLLGASMRDTLLRYAEVLGVLLPEILSSVGFSHRNPHHCYDVWEHDVRAAELMPRSALLRWVMLLHDVGKPAVAVYDEQAQKLRFRGHQKASAELAETIFTRLRFTKEEKERALRLILFHDVILEPTELCARETLRRFGETDTWALIEMHRADNGAQHPDYRTWEGKLQAFSELLQKVLDEGQCVSLKQLAVKGEDLTSLGYRGAAVGETLEALLTAVIREEVSNEKEALLQYTKELKNKE